MILLGGVRSGPVYGKLDFIFLKSCPWWKEWQPMVEKILQHREKKLYTDALTGNVLNAVFGQSIAAKYQWGFGGSKIDIGSIERAAIKEKAQCVINLHGFKPSWVPKETHHWRVRSADTARYYHFKKFHGKILKNILKKNPPIYCDVYF